jgi:hypothetical protein
MIINIPDSWVWSTISGTFIIIGLGIKFLWSTINSLKLMIQKQVPRGTFDELKQEVKDISDKVDTIALGQAKYEGIIDLLSTYLNIHVEK